MKKVFDPRRAHLALPGLTMGSLLILSACGGGGGAGGVAEVISTPPGTGGGAGIGGTGLTATGTVDGTGSIFVNGVRFDVDDAEIIVAGQPAGEDDLGLGMVVTVVGTVEDDGENGSADRVVFRPELEGRIDDLQRNADDSSLRLVVLGQVVIAERTSTVFEDTSYDSLAVGDVVEVSGFRDDEDRLRATRIEGEDESDEAQLSGVVRELEGFRFLIGGQAVDAGMAELDDLPDGALQNGQRVEVEGRLEGDVLVASAVELDDDLALTLQPGDDVVIQGSIGSFLTAADFRVQGLPIDGSSAALSPSGLVLGNGMVVEVRGSWNGNALAADRITARRGRIELEAPLSDVDSAGGSLTLQFGSGVVEVAFDTRTLFDDDRDDVLFLGAGDLRVGDYLEIEALSENGELRATRVDRDDDDDETKVQAPVEAFVEGVSLTVLGLRFDVTGAEFENAGDDDISSQAFFRNLQLGALVRISDDEPADGFAEEVEFEFSAVLDGERDFTDDDEIRIDPGELPARAQAYLEANFPGTDVAFIERDDDEIKVYLADGTEVVFDLAGNFLESDRDDDDSDDGDDDSDDGDDDSDGGDDDSDGGDDDSDDGVDDSDDSDDDADGGDDDSVGGDDDSDDGVDDSDDGVDDSDDSDDDSDGGVDDSVGGVDDSDDGFDDSDGGVDDSDDGVDDSDDSDDDSDGGVDDSVGGDDDSDDGVDDSDDGDDDSDDGDNDSDDAGS